MSYKFAKWSITFKNCCIALLCIAITLSLVTVFHKAQPKRWAFGSVQETRAFLAKELGGEFATIDLSWLMLEHVASMDEDLDYEYQRFAGEDSMGIWTDVEVWIIDGEVHYFYEREEVIKSFLSDL